MLGDDLVPLLNRPGSGRAAVSIRAAVLTAYNPSTHANTVTVGDTDLQDLPLIGPPDLDAGDVVLLLRWRSSWAILGRLVTPA